MIWLTHASAQRATSAPRNGAFLHRKGIKHVVCEASIWKPLTRNDAQVDLDDKVLKALKGVGRRFLDVGFESSYGMILTSQKGFTTKQSKKCREDVKTAKLKFKLVSFADFIFELLRETKDMTRVNIRSREEYLGFYAHILISNAIHKEWGELSSVAKCDLACIRYLSEQRR